MKTPKLLITGHKSGLGRYLHEQLGGIGLGRAISSSKFERIRREGVDVIIHCAFNSTREVDSNNLYQYLSDNVFLTKKLTKIPHKKFIYISSVDAYPKNNKKHSEKEVIDVNEMSGIYATTKVMSESLVQNLCPNFLILRCVALLGAYSRQNSLLKIAEEENPVLTLSADSIMNYILHSQVSDFIKYAVENNLSGIYNVASAENITLARVANLLRKKVSFGNYLYNVGDIDNNKIISISSAFKKTSREAVLEFLKYHRKSLHNRRRILQRKRPLSLQLD